MYLLDYLDGDAVLKIGAPFTWERKGANESALSSYLSLFELHYNMIIILNIIVWTSLYHDWMWRSHLRNLIPLMFRAPACGHVVLVKADSSGDVDLVWIENPSSCDVVWIEAVDDCTWARVTRNMARVGDVQHGMVRVRRLDHQVVEGGGGRQEVVGGVIGWGADHNCCWREERMGHLEKCASNMIKNQENSWKSCKMFDVNICSHQRWSDYVVGTLIWAERWSCASLVRPRVGRETGWSS